MLTSLQNYFQILEEFKIFKFVLRQKDSIKLQRFSFLTLQAGTDLDDFWDII